MFSVSKYFDRIEKASIEILEEIKPVDHTIVLWWGAGRAAIERGWNARMDESEETNDWKRVLSVLSVYTARSIANIFACAPTVLRAVSGAISAVLLWRVLR